MDVKSGHACRVTVGQHGLLPALGGLLKQPVVWAVAIAAASTLTARPIPLLVELLHLLRHLEL